MKNIRIARYPAGTSCVENGHLLQQQLKHLFENCIIDADTGATKTNRLFLTLHPNSSTLANDVLTMWMNSLTINYATKEDISETFKAAGTDVSKEHITSVSITIDNVLYEDLLPVTNIPDNHVIQFTFSKKIKNNADYQYLNLMRDILANGTVKTDRTGTGTTSVFGRQMRFDLNEGIPLLTTKKVHLKSIVHELIWFLAGDTNVKYLQDNGVTIWDEWADKNGELGPVYGAQWRKWHDVQILHPERHAEEIKIFKKQGYLPTGSARRDLVPGEYMMLEKFIDQIEEVMNTLKNNPDSRRIIVSAWNVAELPLMKLAPCHSLFQFYVTDLTVTERAEMSTSREHHRFKDTMWFQGMANGNREKYHAIFDEEDIPRQRLSCQLYQRSLN